MTNTKLEIVDEVPSNIEEQMRDDLVAYEASHGIDVNYKKFALILKHNNGEVIGVLNAFTAFAEIYIEDMWIHSKYRGQGYGRKLINDLENKFRGQGFNNINLCTSAFNAPEFYKKCGFIAEFTRENKKHPKLSKTFFVKFFEDEIQKQGIL